jgi:hypothetical protein
MNALLTRMKPNEQTTWDSVRRIVDELELKIHLARMDARDRWRSLQPRLVKLEHDLEHEGERIGKAVADELSAVGSAMRELRDEVTDEIANGHRTGQ